MPTEAKWIRCKEMAAILSVHPRTLWRWARIGRVPSKRIGTCVRFNPEQVLMQERQQAVPTSQA